MGKTCVVPPDGLVSWWPGDGSSADRVGANPGQILNGTHFVPGKVGGAFAFNGVNDAVRVPNFSSSVLSGDLTIDVWVFPTKDVPHKSIINQWGDAQTFGQRSFALAVGAEGTVEFPLSDSAREMNMSFHTYNTAPGVVPLNSWSHIAAVFNHTTGVREIFVNGVMIGQREDAPFTLAACTTDVMIGAAMQSYGGLYCGFPGLIDELDIFDRALSADEIRAIYDGGSAGKCK